ncbi:alpha/beta hydrolase fold domain-containing protein [Rhodococcus koreensis]|uniref:alpha/beta hydrolase fold domain-containing protein n=1 Tax=Rhodococcus koreensis TaxID=99653 RepID=UPI0036DDA602
MTAKPGMGDQLVELLLTGLDEGNPAATEWCVLYLVSRSAANPDVVTVQEGWTTEEDHHRIFAGEAAQGIVAQFADILAGEPTYGDLIPVRGKADYQKFSAPSELNSTNAGQPAPQEPDLTFPHPPLDPELQDLLFSMPETPPLDKQTLEMIRPYATLPAETAIASHLPVDRQEISIASFDGTQISVTILRPIGIDLTDGNAPCVYWLHGGGMIMGDRYSQIDIPLDWLTRFGAVVVSVDYRLAPEFSGTTLVEDCYTGLIWTADYATDLGIDLSKLVIAGTSAGGGLAAGTALLTRERKGPAIAAQVLIGPMLDHRNNTASSHQFDGPVIWSRDANAFAWHSVLADIGDGPVPSCVSPAIADDLSDLPTTYIDAGSAEVFRDEAVTYATRILAAGGQADLHVWAGGFHGFDALFPHAALSQIARQTRSDWLGRVLAGAATHTPTATDR